MPGCESARPLQPAPGGPSCHLALLSNVAYRRRSLQHCMEDLKTHVGKLITVRGVVAKTGPLSNEPVYKVMQCPCHEHNEDATCVPPANRQIGQPRSMRSPRGSVRLFTRC